MKNISVKLSDYFEIVNPIYIYLKLIPDLSIRNYDSSSIAKTMTYLRKRFMNSFSKDRDKRFKFKYEKPTKFSFIVDIEKNNVCFYFMCDKRYKNVIIEQCYGIWNKITIEEVNDFRNINLNNSVNKYQVYYQKEDAMSLKIDKRLNQPLSSILNVIDIMEESDRVLIIYNFLPIPQKPWIEQYDSTIKKIDDYLPVDKNKASKGYYFKMIFVGIIKVFDSFLYMLDNAVLSGNKKKSEIPTFSEVAISRLQKVLLQDKTKLSYNTNKKRESTIIGTQIVVLSQSNDKNRKDNNGISVCNGFKMLDEDNKLVYEKMHVKNTKVIKDNSFNLTEYKFKNIMTNTMSTEECKMLLELPGDKLLQQHKGISKIDVLESVVPEELRQGIVYLGESEFKGNHVKAYLTNDKEYSNLTLIVIAPTRAGKTTYIGNLSKDCVSNNQCVINIDFCENCELSGDIIKSVGKEKCLVIDCSNEKNLQGLGYNEINSLNSFKNTSKYLCAKMMTQQLLNFVNSINSDDKSFTAKMGRYLKASAMVIFISGESSIKNVIKCLEDYRYREESVNNIPIEEIINIQEYKNALIELNEYKGDLVVGTKFSKIDGILDRIDRLNDNGFMELMYKTNCNNNINFVDEIQKHQAILIKMPEYLFQTQQEKDMAVTYWISKIWLANQIRSNLIPNKDNRTKVAVIIDELYQVPFAQGLVRDKLSQSAKFRLRFVLSCHYLNQIKIIRDELRSANASYMLISGCDKENYNELKEELSPYGLEDLLNLKRFHSLNLIKYEKGYAKFITKLPNPIK